MFKRTTSIAIIAILVAAPIVAVTLLPTVRSSFAQSRAPNTIATTLAFDDGKVVTVQYSQIYFCDSAGPATSPTNSPCKVGKDAVVDPVPDVASSTLNVIIPWFLGTSKTGGIFDPTLGANNFSQCPDNTLALTCPNHPNFLDLAPLLGGSSQIVVPLPIHSHVISGSGVTSSQGGWWKLNVWLVNNSTIWPDPNTGACQAGTGCLTSDAALKNTPSSEFVGGGAIPTTIYLFFNVVSPHSK